MRRRPWRPRPIRRRPGPADEKDQAETALEDAAFKLREVEKRVAGLMEEIADIDDLVVQFDGSDAGRRFIATWNRARVIVDAGHGPRPGDETPPES